MIDQLTKALEGRRFNHENEAELQLGIAQALREAGIRHHRERRLGQDRIDFYLPRQQSLALECDSCGSFPVVHGLLSAAHGAGDRCPAGFLDDYDCDGTLRAAWPVHHPQAPGTTVWSAGIGVEVKTQGALNAVIRQLHRYAHYPEVTELVLLTTRRRHGQVPRELNGKRVHVIFLGEETC